VLVTTTVAVAVFAGVFVARAVFVATGVLVGLFVVLLLLLLQDAPSSTPSIAAKRTALTIHRRMISPFKRLLPESSPDSCPAKRPANEPVLEPTTDALRIAGGDRLSVGGHSR
jgi:hypothetical protein